ncbi:DUF1697 domain-containing protein [Polaromonas jejuensis]|uniref:DUF1697 domain-containing protein n=1 Tax=Polaromonas jejuensis TaxID=457502 RepID=A0ABW0QME9_9BURK|nr:DUF1697 domain-containing protein [Polaromonas jejuensis]
MTQQIAFLRAINVGGHNVSMEALRAHFEALGLANVETFIAGGNVIFTAPAKKLPTLATAIEKHLHTALGYEVRTFIRSMPEVAAIARYQPFPASQLEAAGTLNVAFLAEPLSAEAQKTLMSLKTDIDDFHVQGREVYWLCRKKQSESKFSNALLERALKLQATFRGINTLKRLAAKYAV